MINRLRRRLGMPPDCRDVAAVLQAYLDGELPPSKTRLVTAHLEHCERCGIEADIYRQVLHSLERLASPPDGDAIVRLRSFANRLTYDHRP